MSNKKAKGKITKEALIDQANTALSNLQPELAEKFYRRALSLDSNDTNVIDALADVLLQLGDHDEALKLLLTSTSIDPEANPFKWLYLAQLQSSFDSLASYVKAIELLQESARNRNDQAEILALRKQISKAHCSIAELYMTDLCYEGNAEVECEAAINKAISAYPDSLDGQQALANLRISQCKTEDACAIIEEVFKKVMFIRDTMAARTVMEEIADAPEPAEVADSPEQEFCIATAKCLIECASANPTLAESAMELMGSLMNDDDENIELWYMMGVASLSMIPPDNDSARFHFETARDMMEQLITDMEKDNNSGEFPYQEQYELVKDHLKMLENSASADSNTQSTLAGGDESGGIGNNKSSMDVHEEEADEEWSSDEETEDVN